MVYILTDIDDVLNNLIADFLENIKKMYHLKNQDIFLEKENCKVNYYELKKVFTKKVYNLFKKMTADKFFMSSFLSTDFCRFLTKVVSYNDIKVKVITSRKKAMKGVTLDWLHTYLFPTIDRKTLEYLVVFCKREEKIPIVECEQPDAYFDDDSFILEKLKERKVYKGGLYISNRAWNVLSCEENLSTFSHKLKVVLNYE